MSLLALATVTSDGRPLVGPVDGVFYRGSFYFGSSPDSVRFRHIRHRPHVSATHLPGEELAVTVHGTAVPADIRSADMGGFRQTLLDVYVPRYGAEWETFLDSGPMYARIDADRMFTFHMSAEPCSDNDHSTTRPLDGSPAHSAGRSNALYGQVGLMHDEIPSLFSGTDC